MNVRHIFRGIGVVNPNSIYNEFVFVATWFQHQAFFPPVIFTVPDHGQAAGHPLIEVAAQINLFRLVTAQYESHLPFWSNGRKAGRSFRFLDGF